MMHFFLNLLLFLFLSIISPTSPSITQASIPQAPTIQEEVETTSWNNEIFAEILFPSTEFSSIEQEDNSLSESENPITVGRIYNGLPVFSDNDINRPSSSNNVWIDTNNPGNLMNGYGKGAIGVYLSSNGRYYTVFETVKDGYEAMIEEIVTIKQKLKDLKRDMHLSTFLGGRILGQNWQIDKKSYYYSYAIKKAGSDKRISEISNKVLGEIIMAGEGSLEMYLAGGKDFSHLTTVFIDLEK